MSQLEKLYDIVMSYGRRIRKRFPQEDFDEFWDVIESCLCSISDTIGCEDVTFSSWYREVLPGGVIHSAFTEKVLDLPEKYINGRGDEELIENNHYLIEVFRIPIKDKPTLKNLMRVAFNYGLLSAKIRQKDFPDGIVRTLKHLKAYQICNFISNADAAGLETYLAPLTVKEINALCRKKFKEMSASKIIRAKDYDDSDSGSDGGGSSNSDSD